MRPREYKKSKAEITYRVSDDVLLDQQGHLDRAFDALFDEVLKRRAASPQLDIEPKKGDDTNTN